MSEKFDFSKIEDQKKFEELPNKDQEKIINEAQDDFLGIKEMIDKGEARDYESASEQIEARKHWQNGHLGVTAEDHLVFGGSPDIELSRNRGKTLGELWSVEKISEKLRSLIDFLEKARKEYDKKDPYQFDSRLPRDNIIYAKKELRTTFSYLKSIGKLPKEFEYFEVQDLKNDPRTK